MLSIWTIYDHPRDYPDGYVARRFELDRPTRDAIVGWSLRELRSLFADLGLGRIARHPSDDPVIVETWL